MIKSVPRAALVPATKKVAQVRQVKVDQHQAELLKLARSGGGPGVVHPGSDEYKLVTAHFLGTLGGRDAKIHSVQSLRSRDIRLGTSQRVMFHGCKTTVNERAIVADGFNVTQCVSGGRNYGTWFAYHSAYSDGGFAFNDSHGIRHMFVCLVSDAHVVLDNSTMRVVGQGCACPRWILQYTHAGSGGMGTFSVGAYGRWGPSAAAGGTPSATFGYEVKDGQWVPITTPPGKR